MEIMVKINCDAAWDKETSVAEIGVTAQNNMRNLVDGLGKKIWADSILDAEAIAVKEGMQMAEQKGWRAIIVETDSKILADSLIIEVPEVQWQIRSIVGDLRGIKSRLQEARITHLRREANSRANWVATQSKKEMCPTNWVLLLRKDRRSECTVSVSDTFVLDPG
ncbi:hypothetical protein CDL15_Pgr021847 [Punica granatum]|uniref:RNase H type-1 domain-containing protein n=1 Tax=Punica granatum TaxID=22663 RepID=A0A218WUN2_PUNGR|nr:hypothetical protein CDL15_Pgr021847 [Punica granatum]